MQIGPVAARITPVGQHRQPQRLVAAVGVAPTTTLARLRAEADDVVCVYSTDAFYAVGQFFEDFSEVTDDMVVAVLARNSQSSITQPA